MRPCYKLTLAVLLIALVATSLLAGCKPSAATSWQAMAWQVIRDTIVAPAVTSGWDDLVALLKPLGLYNAQTAKFEIGQDDLLAFIDNLVPAAQQANANVKLKSANAAKAAAKAPK